MPKFRVTLIVEQSQEAETHEDAELLFWDTYHNDSKSLNFEIITEEQDNG